MSAYISVWKSLRTLSGSSSTSRNILLALSLQLLITLPLAYLVNIGVDDAYSLDTTSKDLSYALHQAIHYELQPPLYFLLLYVWRLISPSIFFARLLSVCCMASTLYVVYFAAKRYLPQVPAVWVTVAVALHPYSIWAALFIRPYALAILLSALLLLLFYDGYFSDSPQPSARWLYSLVAVLSLYTHYLLGLFLLGHGLTLLLLKRRGQMAYLLTLGGVAACFGPLLFYLPSHLSDAEGNLPNYSLQSLLSLSRYGLWGLMNHLVPTSNPVSRLLIAKLCRYGMLLGGMAILWRYRRALPLPTRSLVMLLVVMLPGLVGLIWAVTVHSLVNYRFFYPLFIPTVFCSFAVVALCRSLHRKAVLAWFGILLFSSITTLTITYRTLSTEGDWRHVAEYVMQHEQANQPALVFSGESLLPLSHYYQGINSLIPIPRPMSLKVYDTSKLELKQEQDILQPVQSMPDYTELWIIQELDYIQYGNFQSCQPQNSRFNCQILESFIQKYYSVEQQQVFDRSLVRLVRQKPGVVLPDVQQTNAQLPLTQQ